MIDAKALKNDLVKQVKALEDDLREQVGSIQETYDRLRLEYDRAFKVGRTAATWTTWRDERVTQAAVAWVLGTVFVRFTEDNGLLEQPYLTGPDADRRLLAEEAQEDYFLKNPSHTDRDWLLASFEEIARSQAGRLLFDQRHNPLYQIAISHDAAKDLITFWRRRGEDGELLHSFVSEAWDTRFLGDLYQDLSESARKNYALLQTPEFVEEFILDYTLDPAIETFRLDDLLNDGPDPFRMIDPTCGSGHFVLGAFHRILNALREQAPIRDQRELVRRALKAVHGVDINPFAIGIARFRLFIAAIRESGFKSLDELAGYGLPLNLAVGDSLIKVRQDPITGIDEDDALVAFHYIPEDVQDFPGILSDGRYHMVVGNPPYITVKDKKLNERYRENYEACAGTYALSVPFAQRFFELSRPAGKDGKKSGFIGQITSNSFMKREFGKKLIEWFFRSQVELTHVIDTSGAYIPGHGTPTVILVGRNKSHRFPRRPTIRAVLGVRGEPSAPDDPRNGRVWRAIKDQVVRADSESEWVSSVDLSREELGNFPWSLSGGGTGALFSLIQDGDRRPLGLRVSSIGRTTKSGDDSAFLLPDNATASRKGELAAVRDLVVGDAVRDYCIRSFVKVRNPYKDETNLQPRDRSDALVSKGLWPMRSVLARRVIFGQTMEDRGHPWFVHLENYPNRLKNPNGLTFAFVSTHNNFSLDRRGSLFSSTAPVIKLLEGASEDDHLRLLGILNSSLTCFWLKQVSHNKGRPGAEQAGADEPWEHRYEFTATKLQEFPLPSHLPLDRGRELDQLARNLTEASPAHVASSSVPAYDLFFRARNEWLSIRKQMIALQEELDWEVYSSYGLLDVELIADRGVTPELNPGERAFEIVLARKMSVGEVETTWFQHHNHRFTPITELPGHWSPEYRAVVEKRIELIESNRHIGLIERPEYKRRWATEGFDAMQERALRNWLLDRTEKRELWLHELDGMEQPRLLTTAQLADELRKDADVVSVAELFAPGKDLETVVAELVEIEHVPYLAALRHKETGLRKRADWEQIWDEQRREDAATDELEKMRIRDSIAVPPKYGSGDFLKTSYWRNRGKLDVPKERFISYPFAGRDGASTTKDGALLLGWAGFDYREQAQALATLIVERHQNDGWDAEKLTPILAGLREVLPWVRQWHNEFDPNYGGTPAEVYEGHLAQYMSLLEVTDDDLTAWRPPAVRRGRAKKSG